MVTTDWVHAGEIYTRSDVALRWDIRRADVDQLIEAGVLHPLPFRKRACFLGQELIDAVERRLQPEDKGNE